MSSLPYQQNVIAIPVSKLYRLWFRRQNFAISDNYTSDVMVSCDSHAANHRLIATIYVVVAVIAKYGERWLALLPKVCNYELPT